MKKIADNTIKPLEPAQLYKHCDPAHFTFKTTAELEDLIEVVGQARAMEAIRFGVDVGHDGYNVFVLGPAGAGHYELVRKELQNAAAARPASPDWCYVNNFEQPHKPRAISLPTGRGAQFQHHMRLFVEELRSVIPIAFESDEYHNRIEAMNEEFKKRQEKEVEEFGKAARAQGVALLQTPAGFALAPLKNDEVITPDEFEKLPEEEQKQLNQKIKQFEEQLHKIIHQFPRWRREHQTKIREFNRETVDLAVGHLIDELRAQYSDLPEVMAFLDATQADIVENAGELREPVSTEGMEGVTTVSPLQRYQVNLLVGNGARPGAPVEFEDFPTYPNLIGRIEHIAHMGTLVTNFALIKPGALHRANGGYLVLDVSKLLMQPYSWEGLKRALLSHEIRIESLGEMFGLAGTLTLQPQPIPLDVKLVLFGERLFYYLLYQLDPDFAELFKVAADIEDEVERSEDNSALYARMIATLARKHGLRAFERGAVARLIEHGARLAGDAGKLLTHVRSLSDLLIEAEHFAKEAKRENVVAADVQDAIDAQIHRADRMRKHHLESILDGTLLIDTSSKQIGQINGLSVIGLGNYMYAQPTRITATARLGEGNVIDIEREVDLGGSIHSKGVLILTSFLATRYSHSMPLSLNASLVFEQTYGMVEGDSASLAELCALLSALADLPIYQGLAVTGSINQYGQVQPIGAVNEKIEGFFDVCSARGFTGDQGVLIPSTNVKHLMLRRDVVEAVEEKRFHIYAVRDVDEAMELLTGVPAGHPNEQGQVPEGSVNDLVATQLVRLSLMRKEFGVPMRGAAKNRTATRRRKKPATPK
jgi:lon-related putative ATP-dependent protease